MKREKNIIRCGAAACLLALAGCSAQIKSAPLNAMPTSQEIRTMQLPIRVIIYFQSPTEDSKQLFAAISEACLCQPVFFRKYSDDALIYEIALPQGSSLASFEKSLMQNAARLGIKLLEQDRVMQHQ
ncbi:MAG: hypothetical protein WC216_05950 [Gallionella sp.]|jgi:hypothetical protein